VTDPPAGASLAETLIVLMITGLLLGFVADTLQHQNRLVRVQAERAAYADALRVAAVVLQGELRWADPAHDMPAVAPGSVQVRAVRALAIVCGWQGTATLVRLRGIRRPDPDKDSVMLVPGSAVLALRGTADAPDACPHGPDEAVYRITLDERAPRGAMLVFERGSYHLTGNAFRYRRGHAGRQPLTREVFGRARFRAMPLAGAAEALAVHVESRLAIAGRPANLRIVFANAALPLDPDTAAGP
jgi:type II secretory pathway pseudopilin PulG